MNSRLVDAEAWPPLPYEAWKDTLDTLHMWTQVVGKVKLELSPFLNEFWQVAFRLTARGMSTGLIPYRERTFEVNFDFVHHNLQVLTDDDRAKTLPLMFTGMNVDDQTEMLGGMQANAPAEVFKGVWGLFGSAVSSVDRAVVAQRLAIA